MPEVRGDGTVIWHCAEWVLDLTESDGCHWILMLEWDDGEYHPSEDPWIDGNAEVYWQWETLSDEELAER